MLNALPTDSYIGVGREDGKTKGEYAPIFDRKDKFKLLKSGNFWLSEDTTVSVVAIWVPVPSSKLCLTASLGCRKRKRLLS